MYSENKQNLQNTSHFEPAQNTEDETEPGARARGRRRSARSAAVAILAESEKGLRPTHGPTPSPDAWPGQSVHDRRSLYGQCALRSGVACNVAMTELRHAVGIAIGRRRVCAQGRWSTHPSLHRWCRRERPEQLRGKSRHEWDRAKTPARIKRRESTGEPAEKHLPPGRFGPQREGGRERKRRSRREKPTSREIRAPEGGREGEKKEKKHHIGPTDPGAGPR